MLTGAAARLAVGGVDIPDRGAQRRLVLRLQHHIDHFQPRAAAHSLWNYPPSLWIDAGEQAPACQAHSQFRCQIKIAQQLKLSNRPCSTEPRTRKQCVACTLKTATTACCWEIARCRGPCTRRGLTHSLPNADLHGGPLVVRVRERQGRLWACRDHASDLHRAHA